MAFHWRKAVLTIVHITYITEWDESAVRQLVETVKILSKDEVAVTLKGGIEICQKIMY